MRLFVGLEIAEPVLAEVLRIRAALAVAIQRQGVRMVNPGKLHLTLAFLGSFRDEVVPALRESLGGLTGLGEFSLKLGGLGAFPDLRRPKVVWISVDGEAALTTLAAEIARLCRPFAPELDARPFSGHVTLARINPGSRAVGSIVSEIDLSPQPIPFPVSEVVLIHSRTDGVYDCIGRFRLAAGRSWEPQSGGELPTT